MCAFLICRPPLLEALSGGGADLCAAARTALVPAPENAHIRRDAPQHPAGKTLACAAIFANAISSSYVSMSNSRSKDSTHEVIIVSQKKIFWDW